MSKKWMKFITERIQTSKYVCKSGKELNQAIINRYLPGEGINPHIDVPSIFGQLSVTQSMGSWWFLMKKGYDRTRVGMATPNAGQKPNNTSLSAQQKKLFNRLVRNPCRHPLTKPQAAEICRQLLQRKQVPEILQLVASCFAPPSVVDVQMLRMCVCWHEEDPHYFDGFYLETLAIRHGLLLADLIDVAALDSVTTLSRATDAADTAEKQCDPLYAPNLVWNKKQWDAQRLADMTRFVHRYLDLLKIAQAHRGKVADKTLKFLRTFRRRVVLAVNRASVPV